MTISDDLRQQVSRALREHGMVHLGDQVPADEYDCCADVAIEVMQAAYVPPPPGSDRDKLPDHVLAVIAPHMAPYTSTACQVADALEAAARQHPGMAAELLEWAHRMRSACRLTRKQDMALCQHPQHQEVTP